MEIDNILDQSWINVCSYIYSNKYFFLLREAHIQFTLTSYLWPKMYALSETQALSTRAARIPHPVICPGETIYNVPVLCCCCLLLVSVMQYCNTSNLAVVANIAASTTGDELEGVIVLGPMHVCYVLLNSSGVALIDCCLDQGVPRNTHNSGASCTLRSLFWLTKIQHCNHTGDLYSIC